jgi:accessory gene regulator B
MLLILSLLIFRPQIGGLHFDSYSKCFSFTLLFSIIVIFLNNSFSLTKETIIYLGSFNFICIFLFAPMVSKQKKSYVTSGNSWKISLLSLVHTTLLLIFPQNLYLLITIWALFFQSIQLLIGRGGEIYETLYSKNTQTN